MESVSISKRIQEAMRTRGLNQSQLAIAAGLSQGYVSNVFARDPKSMKTDIAEKFAAALGVQASWILTGAEGFAPVESPAPPPTTTDSAADELIAAAFDPSVHNYLDTVPVRAALKTGAPLMKQLDPTEFVRRMLDVATKRRQRGQTVTGADLHGATVQDAFEETRDLRAQLAMREQVLAEAHAWLRAHGIDPDALDKPPLSSTSFTPTEPKTTPRPKSGAHGK
jgi:transcriptional regulator with XRE-family HTH domain